MKDAIGVIGGMGPLASQLFYKMITEHTAAECDQDHVPLLILSDVTMPDRTGAILDGKYDAPYNRLMEDAKFLEEYGCTAVVVTCNDQGISQRGGQSSSGQCRCGIGNGWNSESRTVPACIGGRRSDSMGT